MMNIQNHIVKIITTLQEAGAGVTRDQLRDIMTESQNIAKGCDDKDWNCIIDHAIKEGLIKVKNQKLHTLTYTQEGKKFCKKPHPVILGKADDNEKYNGINDQELASVMSRSTGDSPQVAEQKVCNPRTKRQIKLIQAIDRKIALDDFAQNENIDLDEVIDELEALRHSGKEMDITYFTDEVIGSDEVDEVCESLGLSVDRKVSDSDILKMRREWSDVYNDQELRLLAYILS